MNSTAADGGTCLFIRPVCVHKRRSNMVQETSVSSYESLRQLSELQPKAHVQERNQLCKRSGGEMSPGL